jgi:hypothetical protein
MAGGLRIRSRSGGDVDITQLNISLKPTSKDFYDIGEHINVSFAGCSVTVQLHFHQGRPMVRLLQHDSRGAYVTDSRLELKTLTGFDPCYEDVSATPEFSDEGFV